MRYLLLAALLVTLACSAMAVDLGNGDLTVNAGQYKSSGQMIDGPLDMTDKAIGGWVDLSQTSMPNGWSNYYFWFSMIANSGNELAVNFCTDTLGGWRGIPSQPWDRVRCEFKPVGGTYAGIGDAQRYYCTQGGLTDDSNPPTQIYPSDRVYYFQLINNGGNWDMWVYGKGYGGGNEVDYKQWHQLGTTFTKPEFNAAEINTIEAGLWCWSGLNTVSWRGLRIGEPVSMDVAPPATLALNSQVIYVQPGQEVTVNMDVSDLPELVNGCQALLGFDTTKLGNVAVAPAQGSVWNEAWISELGLQAGSFDAIAVINVENDPTLGTMAAGTTAKLTFNAVQDGETTVWFREDVDAGYATFLSTVAAEALYPTKSNSQSIVIDGTDPTMTFAGVNPKYLIGDEVNISVTPADERSGVASIEMSVTKDGNQVYHASGSTTLSWIDTVAATWANGTYVISATVTDNAGNDSTETTSVEVNKNQVSGTVTMPGFVGAKRDVNFALEGPGYSEKRTVELTFTNGVAEYQLRDILPIATLSADTDWALLDINPIGADANGQYASHFTLLGGDLNNDGIVNALDYSILKASWGSNSRGDIDGNGTTYASDYGILKNNWFKRTEY